MGLHGVYLEHDAGFMDGFCMLAHYYPPCPEPHHTLGTAKHCDATFITVLLQDAVGGLQALHGGRWVEVPGALIVNVGDFLQVTG
jgi:2,4-dihydroxy-1,4-benzoxazin-3-one-glucoside dioxygenase